MNTLLGLVAVYCVMLILCYVHRTLYRNSTHILTHSCSILHDVLAVIAACNPKTTQGFYSVRMFCQVWKDLVEKCARRHAQMQLGG